MRFFAGLLLDLSCRARLRAAAASVVVEGRDATPADSRAETSMEAIRSDTGVRVAASGATFEGDVRA